MNQAKVLSILERSFFAGLIAWSAMSVFNEWRSAGVNISVILEIIRYFLILFFLVTASIPKHQPVDLSSLIGVIGSFICPLFVIVRHVRPDKIVLISFTAALVFYVTVLSVAYVNLGRNLGILPAVRSLTTRGMYGVVRHPIYSCYIFIMACFALLVPVWQNFLALFAFIFFLYLRVRGEERILRERLDYDGFQRKVKWRFFSPVLATPFVLFAVAAFGFRDSPPAKVSFKLAYPVMSLDPTIYDDWSSLFVANHIFVRLIGEPKRGTRGLFDSVHSKCIQKGNVECVRSRIELDWPTITDCQNGNVKKSVLTYEFWKIVEFHNWILPNLKKCESPADVCVEFNHVDDLARRLKNVYFRFGWSLPKTDAPYGTGAYCLVRSKSDGGGFTEGTMESRDKTSILDFVVTQDDNFPFDVNPYGARGDASATHLSLDSNTPLAYFLVSNFRNGASCLPWESAGLLSLVRDHFSRRQMIFPMESATQDFFGKLPMEGCTNPVFSKPEWTEFYLPDYIPDCEVLSDAIEKFLVRYQIAAKCVDTTKFLQEKVINRKHRWLAFVSPLSPGYPGRDAIQNQYFNPISRMSWTMDAPHPEKKFYLIGVGRSYITVKRNLFCGIRPSPLGMGDLVIGDLTSCQ